MSQPKGQWTIIGQQQQPFAFLIETANRVHALMNVGYQIHSQRSARWIMIGAQNSPRLVYCPVNKGFCLYRSTIHHQFVALLHAAARLNDTLTIDADAASCNQGIAMTPRSNSRRCQCLIQAITFGHPPTALRKLSNCSANSLTRASSAVTRSLMTESASKRLAENTSATSS
jgi:hypothetical protein